MKKICLLVTLALFAFAAGAQKKQVKIITPYGNMIIALSDETPVYRDNFVRLVKKHFYKGLLFHRVIADFMIQGGDPDSRHARPGQNLGDGDLGYTLPADFHADLFHRKGALAAARQPDAINPEKASSPCQFYIVEGKTYDDATLDLIERKTGHTFTTAQREVYKTVGGTPFLDGSYTVFGQLIEGMDVLDKISAVSTDARDRPVRDIPMKIKRVHHFLFF